MITKKDLLKKLERDNTKISDRMLTHFISLGLIKKPVRHGLGKGKGSVSKFDDRTFNDIKEILKLREEDLTYEEIKIKRLSSGEWLSLVNEVRKSCKSAEDVTNFIKKIPYLSDREKGRLKLASDLTDRLTKVVVDELESILGRLPIGDEESEEAVIYDIRHAIENALPNVLHDFSLSDEDCEEYLNKGALSRRGTVFLHSKRRLKS
ncbi:MAG: hypothetical protein E3K29_03925 [Candidatus Brocadia sp.]|nr:hypothetical protein [Candidatus Brocadia sp.]